MRNKVLTIIALLGIAVGSIRAAETTVTYKMTATFTLVGSREQANITFVRFGDKLSGPTGEKTATIANVAQCTGFSANLDDGLTLKLRMNEGLVRMAESDGYRSILLNYTSNNNTYILIGSANYYIKHIKLADAGGHAIYGSAPPFFSSATGLDVDVDLVKNTGGGGTMALFNANVTSYAILGEITVTYADAPRTYNITYNNAVDGVDGVTNECPASYDVLTSGFQITAPSRTGYDFAGYYRNAEMSGSPFTLPITIRQASVIDIKNLALYAKWTAHTYYVGFNSNDGNDEYVVRGFTYDHAQELSTNHFTRTGYHIDSWTTAPDGSGTSYDDGEEVSNLTAVDGAVIDLYAQWKINTYTVRFNKNGGVGTMEDQAFYYDEQKALTANTFSRTGYHFKGWNTASNGSGDSYTGGQEVKNLTVEHGAVIDLYAQWEAKTIAVTFDWGNEATGGTTSVTATYDAPMPAITLPTWEGHCFGGYWSRVGGRGELYYNAEGTLNTTCKVTSDALTLYAYWLDPITYIDADGIEKTCTQYEVIDFNPGRVLGKDNADNWYTIIGGILMRDIVFKGNAHIIMPKDNADIIIEFIYADGGDVHIYTNEGAEGKITSEIRVVGERKGDVFIHGGNVELSIRDANSINIGWTKTNDEITLSIINEEKFSIKEGQYFYCDDLGIINGTVSSPIRDNSILYPVIPMSDVAANSSVIASYSNKLGGFGLLGRTIYNDGAWNTICIPGGVIRGNGINPIDNLYTIMELDTEGKYNDAGQADEGGNYQTGIKDGILYLYFKETTTIDPGKPYIVRYNRTIERHIVNPFFGGTKIADVSAYTGTDAEKCQAFLEDNAAVSKDGRVRFIGQFDPFPIDDSNRYKTIMLGPNNTLGYTESDYLHTMRAHFEILDATAVKGYSISFGEAGTTGIIPIKAEHAAQGIYTLDGLRLESVPTRKGIYIRDGKKVQVND